MQKHFVRTIFWVAPKIFVWQPDSKSSAMIFFQGNQERVRNSHGKRAIRVRAIEVLL